MWSIADIADAIEAGLVREERRLVREHAVYGIDARDELELHPLLARSLRAAGYGVAREQRYPSDWKRRKASEGERCDLVLTPDGRPLVVPDAKATLFEPDDAVALDDAFWLEVKTVAQFTTEGPNGSYSSQLLSTVRQDVVKLSKDADILHAGLLLLLFVAEPAVADHDLGVWQDRCLDRGLPIGAPSRRMVTISDRLGNAVCALALYPIRHL